MHRLKQGEASLVTIAFLYSYLLEYTMTSHYYTMIVKLFSLPLCRTSVAQRSFYYRALKSWNNLSVSTRNSPSLAQFKRNVRAEMRNARRD